jgi:electron transfer flavoprotein alpha subunit
MKIIAFAEQREGKLKKSAFEVVTAGNRLAQQLGAELVSLVVGHNLDGIAPALGDYGARRILIADHQRLSQYSTTAYSKVVAEIVRKEQATILLFPASQMGKDLAPRVAGKLSAGVASDCTALRIESGNIIATRPVYAGKALADVKVTSPIQIYTLRPNVFNAVIAKGSPAAVEKISCDVTDADLITHVTGKKVTEGRPDVTEASIIVSGGRGMKGPENFTLIEKLADTLGAAVGASRAVVDAGWRPHDEQVGQTGKTVAPNLYIACGISGAIQHLAGMSSSKYIVAINKDKDAPIFQVADYGIVGDVFEILPALTEELRKAVGS